MDLSIMSYPSMKEKYQLQTPAQTAAAGVPARSRGGAPEALVLTRKSYGNHATRFVRQITCGREMRHARQVALPRRPATPIHPDRRI
jgi:hypothetical protein